MGAPLKKYYVSSNGSLHPFIHPFFYLTPFPSSKKVDFVYTFPIEMSIYMAKRKYLTSTQGLPQTSP